MSQGAALKANVTAFLNERSMTLTGFFKEAKKLKNIYYRVVRDDEVPPHEQVKIKLLLRKYGYPVDKLDDVFTYKSGSGASDTPDLLVTDSSVIQNTSAIEKLETRLTSLENKIDLILKKLS